MATAFSNGGSFFVVCPDTEPGQIQRFGHDYLLEYCRLLFHSYRCFISRQKIAVSAAIKGLVGENLIFENQVLTIQ